MTLPPTDKTVWDFIKKYTKETGDTPQTTEISNQLEMRRATVTAVVERLKKEGLLEKCERSPSYRIK